MVDIDFIDPYKVAEVITKEAPASEEEATGRDGNFGYLNAPRDSKVFDIGHGTGRLGKLLTEAGFTELHSADASSEFVAKMAPTGLYKSTREYWFGRGTKNLPAEWKGEFDIVMATGVFTDDCIPCTGFDDAHALLKTGGHFVTCLRQYYLEDGHPSGYASKI